jgi:PilZ domain
VEKFVCPKCNEYSYSADDKCFSPCPHCELNFSGKYGADRRCEERVKQEVPIVFSYQGEHLEVRTKDFSQEGLGIKILGNPSIDTGYIVNLSIGDEQMKAKVIWANKLSDETVAGLQKMALKNNLPEFDRQG